MQRIRASEVHGVPVQYTKKQRASTNAELWGKGKMFPLIFAGDGMKKGICECADSIDGVLNNARIYNVNQCEIQVCKCVDSIHTQCILLIFTFW